MNWYSLQGSSNRMWALYLEAKPTGYRFKKHASDVLGHIERMEDGSWGCFDSKNRWCSNEPNRKYAMMFINNINFKIRTERMKYWECECCGSLLVTAYHDDATRYQCPQCHVSHCNQGLYCEITVDAFCDKANIVNNVRGVK